MSEMKNRLRVTIVKALGRDIEPTSIKGEDMIHELGITSIDALEILIWIENEYGIHIDDGDLSQALVSSLDALESYVTGKLSAVPAAAGP